jgi:segregation and condensation protein B
VPLAERGVSEPRVVPVGPGPDADDEGTLPDEEAFSAELDDAAQADDEALLEDESATSMEGLAAEDDGGADAVGSASVADIEALLFVAERPLTRDELRTLGRLSAEEVDERLGDLEMQLRDRGIRLISSGERVMLGTSPESGPLIARYLGADAVRLSPAALETLAIVAYRQPVTRGVIERIRGVDSGHVVRGLLHRRLIHEQGRADSPGRPILFATSMEFMERFGLTSLDDLPPLEADIAARVAQAEADAAEGLAAEGDLVASVADRPADPGGAVDAPGAGVGAATRGSPQGEGTAPDDREPSFEDG